MTFMFLLVIFFLKSIFQLKVTKIVFVLFSLLCPPEFWGWEVNAMDLVVGAGHRKGLPTKLPGTLDMSMFRKKNSWLPLPC